MEERARLIGKTSLTPIIVSSSVKYRVSAFPNETAVACVAWTVPVALELEPVTVSPAANVAPEVFAALSPFPSLCSLNFRTEVLVTS